VHNQKITTTREVSRVIRTFAVVAIIPKALNVSYNSLSSTLSSKLPMNRFAPTSSCFLSEDAYSW